ncbi:MAG: polymerase, sigma-24 subunit, subfamily [Chloroflexi bacterium]|jgi:RNA polymerase sigma factor (sigma-70 family)|nr:polymerase, sigma-24 subunit, subfamily [Chloroflexota bacterium]
MARVVVGHALMQYTGVRDSFERLFIAEYARVVAVADRILGDVHEAEDVAQEVFTDYHHRHPADAPYAAAWLYRAAVHTALNSIRGKRRRLQRETLHERDSGRLSLDIEPAQDPQHALLKEELRDEVRAALCRIPPKSASVLALRYSGMSYLEIAEVLGVRVNQVGTLLRRAEAAFRKEVDREPSR